MGDPRTRRPEFQETCASCSRVCEIPHALEKSPTQTVGVSRLIFDKRKSAGNILETWGFMWFVTAKETLFTYYSIPPVATLPASCLSQPSGEVCLFLTGSLPHWLMSLAALLQP